jgi:hypothetical protein
LVIVSLKSLDFVVMVSAVSWSLVRTAQKVLVQRLAATAFGYAEFRASGHNPSPRDVKNRALHGEHAHPDGYALKVRQGASDGALPASACFQHYSKEANY